LKIESIDVEKALDKACKLIEQEKGLSSSLRAALEVLLLLVKLLLDRKTLNSKNSSKPPSSDPNRLKSTRKKSTKKSGAQTGHVGKTLEKVDDPDFIETLSIDRRSLPKGHYHQVGFETRQVFDIDISRIITEYQAQILEDEKGCRFVAAFPDGVTKAVQYGNQIKAHAVYLSQFQLLPYKRIQTYFADQLQIPLSEGSLYNFNVQAFTKLADFEQMSKDNTHRLISPMPMKPVLTSMANVSGYIVLLTRSGHTTFPIKNGGRMRWIKSIYCLASRASFVMTTGNLITVICN
jgi:transposase